MSERNYELSVDCRMCHKTHTLLVRIEDFSTFISPNRPLIQDCFPYLTSAERELLVSGTCPECWQKMFGGEDDE